MHRPVPILKYLLDYKFSSCVLPQVVFGQVHKYSMPPQSSLSSCKSQTLKVSTHLPSRYQGAKPNGGKIILLKGWDVTEATLKTKHSRKLVKGRAQYHLTQACSKIKKPPGSILNILDLTSIIPSKGDDVVVNEVLCACACVALMRAAYVEHPDDTLWDFLDLRIENTSKAATGDSSKIVAFHHVLTVDQKKYDAEDVYEIEKTGASVFQDEIDGMIDGGGGGGWL
ncbi:hypothetical protein C8R45DRAFT_1108009 [Mycena sanguinolenta]|nr:hypothetical protein C8R45DRAFT_1108009 [Mycena sanguinolenta]